MTKELIDEINSLKTLLKQESQNRKNDIDLLLSYLDMINDDAVNNFNVLAKQIENNFNITNKYMDRNLKKKSIGFFG